MNLYFSNVYAKNIVIFLIVIFFSMLLLYKNVSLENFEEICYKNIVDETKFKLIVSHKSPINIYHDRLILSKNIKRS